MLLLSGMLGSCSRPVGEMGGCRGLSAFFSLPVSSPGTFSASEEERPSEERDSTTGLYQASGPPMLVQKKACGAGDRARGAAGGPWGLSMLPHPCGQPSKQGKVGTLVTGPGPGADAHGPRLESTLGDEAWSLKERVHGPEAPAGPGGGVWLACTL